MIEIFPGSNWSSNWHIVEAYDFSPFDINNGQNQDSSGLQYFYARYADGARGRWTSPDPITSHTYDPQSLNKYVYVRNDPVNLLDSGGRSAAPFMCSAQYSYGQCGGDALFWGNGFGSSYGEMLDGGWTPGMPADMLGALQKHDNQVQWSIAASLLLDNKVAKVALALLVFTEARGQNQRTWQAVAEVAVNRFAIELVTNPALSIIDVILQTNQFSAFNRGNEIDFRSSLTSSDQAGNISLLISYFNDGYLFDDILSVVSLMLQGELPRITFPETTFFWSPGYRDMLKEPDKWLIIWEIEMRTSYQMCLDLFFIMEM